MKKGICFMMAAALCAMLLTACGNDSRQSDNANAQDQSGSNNTVESSQAEHQDNGVITGTEELCRIRKTGTLHCSAPCKFKMGWRSG